MRLRSAALVGAVCLPAFSFSCHAEDWVLAPGKELVLVDADNPLLRLVLKAPENEGLDVGALLPPDPREGIYGVLTRIQLRASGSQMRRDDEGAIVLGAPASPPAKAANVQGGFLVLQSGRFTLYSSAATAVSSSLERISLPIANVNGATIVAPAPGTVGQAPAAALINGTVSVSTGTPSSVINWSGFSAGAGSLSGATSGATINRVTAGPVAPTGVLQSGNVFLANPTGAMNAGTATIGVTSVGGGATPALTATH